MARKDKTFTGADIVRIWCNNLDTNEQNEVFTFFFIIVPGIYLTNAQTIAILDNIEKVATKWIHKAIIAAFKRYLQGLRLIVNTMWAEIIFSNQITKKEVIKCIQKRLSELTKKDTSLNE